MDYGVKKIVMFVFSGDPVCFMHVLMNALDMFESDYETKIVIEGAATALIPEPGAESNMLNQLWEKAKNFQIIDGVCMTCSKKMGTMESVKTQGVALLDDMEGHPGVARYRDEGFEVIVF